MYKLNIEVNEMGRVVRGLREICNFNNILKIYHE